MVLSEILDFGHILSKKRGFCQKKLRILGQKGGGGSPKSKISLNRKKNWAFKLMVSAVTAKMAEVPSSNSVVHPTRPPSTASASAPSFPPASVATSAWVGGSRIGSNTPSRRSYEQIIADSSSNILIRITIQKIIDSEKPDDKPRSLSI